MTYVDQLLEELDQYNDLLEIRSNIDLAELRGEITSEQAESARQSLGVE